MNALKVAVCPMCNSNKGFKTMRKVPVIVNLSIYGDFEHYEEDMDLETFGPTYECLKCNSKLGWDQIIEK